MKNLIRTGLFALCVGVLATGCDGCGDRTKTQPEETVKAAQDSPVKVKDTTKAAIDTAKKDTSKKK